MKMPDLLRTLAEDDRRPPLGLGTQLIVAISVGSLVSAVLLLGSAGARPDFPGAAAIWYVQIKFLFALLLAVTSLCAALAAAQPESRNWRTAYPVVAAPAILLAAVALELVTTPSSDWMKAAMGTHPLLCLIAVPLLSAAPLAATFFVMRAAAPASPGRAGALTGLLSGALGAGVYMLRCTDDAPLFVASWYTIAILSVAAVGWCLGRISLRW